MRKDSAGYDLTFEKNLAETKAKIVFTTAYFCKATVKIMNNDEEVRLLLNEKIDSGKHTVLFDYNRLPHGDYAVKLIIETETAIDKETIIMQL